MQFKGFHDLCLCLVSAVLCCDRSSDLPTANGHREDLCYAHLTVMSVPTFDPELEAPFNIWV